MPELNAVCRSCGAGLEACVLDLGPQPVADLLVEPADIKRPDLSAPLRLLVCSQCWLVQLAPVALAHPRAVHGHGAAFSTTVLRDDELWAEHLAGMLGLQTGARVLDVAADDGHLLRAFAARGAQVLGVEDVTEAVHVARQSGIRIRTGPFNLELARALRGDGWQADLILVNHELAHLQSPDTYLTALETVLAPGGALAIQFHHVLAIARDLHWDVACHAHQSYLGLLSLEALLARHDLRVVDARAVAAHGGSVRAIVRRATDRVAPYPSVEELRNTEVAAGLDRLEGYRHIQRAAQKSCEGLTQFLVRASAEGKRVIGYGAANRGVTLLNLCGATARQLSSIIDRAERKQGRFLPGCRIPVEAPAALFAQRPEYVLILAWPLAEEIKQQLSQVREWHGRFVVAMPELRVFD